MDIEQYYLSYYSRWDITSYVHPTMAQIPPATYKLYNYNLLSLPTSTSASNHLPFSLKSFLFGWWAKNYMKLHWLEDDFRKIFSTSAAGASVDITAPVYVNPCKT